MDDIRDSFSRLKKDLKYRLRGRKHKPDITGASTVEERVDSSGSLLRPDSHAVVGGHHGERSGTGAAGRQARSKDLSPQLAEPRPTSGSRDNRQRGEADVDAKEVKQRHLRPDPDIEIKSVGSGPGQAEQIYPSSSTPSIPPDGT